MDQIEPQSLLCPRCQKLISSYLEECSHCGLPNPGQAQKLTNWSRLLEVNPTKVLIWANVLYFLLSLLLSLFLPHRGGGGILPSPDNLALELLGWADPRRVLAGQWWLLITALFLHGGILHILFNMLWARDLGKEVSFVFGPFKMLLIYLFAGVCGNLLAVFWPVIAWEFGVEVALRPTIGASGAVFGLMGAMLAFGKRTGGLVGGMIVKQVTTWAVIIIIMGVILPNVSNTGHIGGFLGGIALGWLLPYGRPGGPKLRLVTYAALGITLYAFGMVFWDFFRLF